MPTTTSFKTPAAYISVTHIEDGSRVLLCADARGLNAGLGITLVQSPADTRRIAHALIAHADFADAIAAAAPTLAMVGDAA